MTPATRRDGLPAMLALALVSSACTAAVPVPSAGHAAALPGASASVAPGNPLEPALPTLLPESVLTRVPTRVRVPALRIDLPIVAPPAGDVAHFPYCAVAEYLPAMSRPGRPGVTFIYAHARAGMFLPIHESASVDGGRSLLGLEVDVFSSDDRQFTYEITDVRRHVVSLDFAYRATAEQLILQTSEGPRATPEKTIVVAEPRKEQPASPAESHPAAKPVRCT